MGSLHNQNDFENFPFVFHSQDDDVVVADDDDDMHAIKHFMIYDDEWKSFYTQHFAHTKLCCHNFNMNFFSLSLTHSCTSRLLISFFTLSLLHTHNSLKLFLFSEWRQIYTNKHTHGIYSLLMKEWLLLAGCYVDRTNIFILGKLYHFAFSIFSHTPRFSYFLMAYIHIIYHMCVVTHSTHV